MPQDIVITVKADTSRADRQLQTNERLVAKLVESTQKLTKEQRANIKEMERLSNQITETTKNADILPKALMKGLEEDKKRLAHLRLELKGLANEKYTPVFITDMTKALNDASAAAGRFSVEMRSHLQKVLNENARSTVNMRTGLMAGFSDIRLGQMEEYKNRMRQMRDAYAEQERASQAAWLNGVRPLLNGIANMSVRSESAINALRNLIQQEKLLADVRQRYEKTGDAKDLNLYIRRAEAVDRAKRAFDATQRSVRAVDTSVSHLNDTIQRTASATHGMSRGWERLRFYAESYLSLYSLKAIGTYADRYQDWMNKLTASMGSQQQAREIIPDLHKVANDARADIDSIVTLYSRLNLANDHLKLNSQELTTVTKALSQSFILSGATSQEAKNAIIQFTQAISKGYLNGDELRSVTEQNIVFTRLLAKEMNTTAGGLRDLGAKGLLTAETLVKVLKDAAGSFDQQMSQMPVTFGQALQMMSNDWQMTFSKIANDRQLGQSLVKLTKAISNLFTNPVVTTGVKGFVDLLKTLSDNLMVTSGAVIGLLAATGKLGLGFAKLKTAYVAFIASMKTFGVQLKANYATMSATATGLGKVAAAAKACRVAFRGLSVAIKSLFGMGIGLLIGVIVDKIAEWATETSRSTEEARGQTSAIDDLIDQLSDLSKAYDEVSKSIRNMSKERLEEQRSAALVRQKAALEKINEAFDEKYTPSFWGIHSSNERFVESLLGREWNAKNSSLTNALFNTQNLSKVVGIFGNVRGGFITAADGVKQLNDVLSATRNEMIKTGASADKLQEFINHSKQLVNLLKDIRTYQVSDKAYQDTIKNKEILDAAKLDFLSNADSASMAKILEKRLGGKEVISLAFGEVFKSEDNKRALQDSLAWLRTQLDNASSEELDKWSSDAKYHVLTALDKIKGALRQENVQPLADFFSDYFARGIRSRQSDIAKEIDKGVKSAWDTAIKHLSSTGQLSKLYSPMDAKTGNNWLVQSMLPYMEKLGDYRVSKLKEFAHASAELEYAQRQYQNSYGKSSQEIAKYARSVDNAQEKLNLLGKALAAVGINMGKLNKEVVNYQKAINQNAFSEVMSLVGKGATVDENALKAIFERAKIKEQLKDLQSRFTASMETATTDEQRLAVLKEYLPQYQALIDAEHRWGEAIDFRQSLANKDKDVQKILDKLVKKGGSSSEMRPFAQMSVDLGLVNNILTDMMGKTALFNFFDKLSSGSAHDALIRLTEGLANIKQLLIDSQVEILNANKAMSETETIVNNLKAAEEKIRAAGGMKLLSAADAVVVKKAFSEAQASIKKFTDSKEKLDGFIAKLEEVRDAFVGILKVAAAVANVMSKLGMISGDAASEINAVSANLQNSMNSMIDKLKTTSTEVGESLETVSKAYNDVKSTSDFFEHLGDKTTKAGKKLNEFNNTLGGAIDRWKKFQDTIPIFAIQLESNMESAAKSVMNWKMDMVDAVSDIGSGIVKSLVKGEDAMESLKNTLSSLADHFIEMSIRMLTYNMFWNLIGGGMTGGMGGGLFSGLFGGLFGHHTGGVIGSDAPSFIRKYHTGGIIGSDEELAILQNGEGVFTRGQMQAIGEGMSANRGNVVVDVRFDPSLKGEVTTEQEVIEQDNQMTKVVLNVIRNNKRTVSSMLGSNTRAQ